MLRFAALTVVWKEEKIRGELDGTIRNSQRSSESCTRIMALKGMLLNIEKRIKKVKR